MKERQQVGAQGWDVVDGLLTILFLASGSWDFNLSYLKPNIFKMFKERQGGYLKTT